MSYAQFITDYEMADELAIDMAPHVRVLCTCGETVSYMQDAPGNRCFDPVYCHKCGNEVGKT